MNEPDKIQLLCTIEHTTSLQEIIELGTQLFGNPIFYHDVECNIPFYTQSMEITDSSWVDGIIHKNITNQCMHFEISQIIIQKRYAETKEPVYLPPREEGDRHSATYAVPLSNNNQNQGVLILTQLYKLNDESELQFFCLFTKMFESKLKRIVEMNLGSKSLIESYMFRLLDGVYVETAELENHFQLIGFKPKKYYFILTFWDSPIVTSNAPNYSNDVIAYFTRFPEHKLIRYRSSLVCIYTSDQPLLHLEEDANDLFTLIQEKKLVAGISTAFTDPNKMSFYYFTSLNSAEIGMRMIPDQFIYTFEEMSPYCLLNLWEDNIGNSTAFIHPKLKYLKQYDIENGRDLYHTLEAYIYNNMDMQMTAKALFTHPNTVRYRIQQCVQLLEYHSEKEFPLWEFYLSFKTDELLKSYPAEVKTYGPQNIFE